MKRPPPGAATEEKAKRMRCESDSLYYHDTTNDNIAKIEPGARPMTPPLHFRFKMGYVPDCPRCAAKVPGHFSHFIPN